jgi:hypothetical protein
MSRVVGFRPDKKSDYVFRSNHLAHITLVKLMPLVAHGFHMRSKMGGVSWMIMIHQLIIERNC